MAERQISPIALLEPINNNNNKLNDIDIVMEYLLWQQDSVDKW